MNIVGQLRFELIISIVCFIGKIIKLIISPSNNFNHQICFIYFFRKQRHYNSNDVHKI